MSTVTTIQTYPFDPTGTKVSNRVSGEQQVFSPSNSADYYFLVPKFAPFFEDSLTILYKGEDGTVRSLDKDVDFYATHKFIGASAACAKPIFGSISFNNLSVNGIVTLGYQTIGGEWVLDDTGILEVLADKQENPRVTSWDVVANVPKLFPPVDHEWNLVDQVGLKELVASVDNLGQAILTHQYDNTDMVNATNAALDAAAKAQAAVDNLANIAAKWSLISGVPQAISDIATSGEKDPVAMLALANHLAAMDPHSQYATKQYLADAIAQAKSDLTTKFTENLVTVNATTSSTVLDLSQGSTFLVNISVPTTLSFKNAPPAGQVFSFAVKTKNPATAGIPMAIQAGTKFAGGILPPRTTDAYAEDVWTFFTDSGLQTIYGSLAIADAK
jgi:hypothetical protein